MASLHEQEFLVQPVQAVVAEAVVVLVVVVALVVVFILPLFPQTLYFLG